MDTSKKYIEMCEKAEEIQKLKPSYWNILEHNFYWPGVPNIWLPRQDQLQEMVKSSEIFIHKNPERKWALWEDVDEGGPLGISYHDSMEQLWLAFVMKEKFGKIWNRSNWVKEDL